MKKKLSVGRLKLQIFLKHDGISIIYPVLYRVKMVRLENMVRI